MVTESSIALFLLSVLFYNIFVSLSMLFICLQLWGHQQSSSWLHDHDIQIMSSSPSLHGLFHLQAPVLYSDDRVALVLEGWQWPVAGVRKGLLNLKTRYKFWVSVWTWLATRILSDMAERWHFSLPDSWCSFFHIERSWHAGLCHLLHTGEIVLRRQR